MSINHLPLCWRDKATNDDDAPHWHSAAAANCALKGSAANCADETRESSPSRNNLN